MRRNVPIVNGVGVVDEGLIEIFKHENGLRALIIFPSVNNEIYLDHVHD